MVTVSVAVPAAPPQMDGPLISQMWSGESLPAESIPDEPASMHSRYADWLSLVVFEAKKGTDSTANGAAQVSPGSTVSSEQVSVVPGFPLLQLDEPLLAMATMPR